MQCLKNFYQSICIVGALATWHSDHCVNLQNRSRVRIPPGCKAFKEFIHCSAVVNTLWIFEKNKWSIKKKNLSVISSRSVLNYIRNFGSIKSARDGSFLFFVFKKSSKSLWLSYPALASGNPCGLQAPHFQVWEDIQQKKSAALFKWTKKV
jgi:hypothetical protein